MPGPRRDRPAVLLLLGALLAADLYFHLWPRVRKELAPEGPGGPGCPCRPPRPATAAAAVPSPPPPPPPPRGRAAASALRRLFGHPLYRATEPPGPAEPLLGAREALRYYRRKAARWNRCVPPPRHPAPANPAPVDGYPGAGSGEPAPEPISGYPGSGEPPLGPISGSPINLGTPSLGTHLWEPRLWVSVSGTHP